MKTVWKFSFIITGAFEIEMPEGAKILKVGFDINECPQIWAQVNTEAKKVWRNFRIYGTGHSITHCENMEYLDTLQAQPLQFVWHLFEEIK